MSASAVAAARRHNPYVGPRAFLETEWLPARDREKHEVADLLISERVLLLHSPSGAGKTSLIQAGVIPLLRDEQFLPTRPLRVNAPVSPGHSVRNRYIYSIGLDLLDASLDPASLSDLTLEDVVERTGLARGDRIPVLVIDQFEELLTLDPTDWENQKRFFKDLGHLLNNNPRVWVLLSMREDYMGGLDRFARYVPTRLRTTYRLDFLDLQGAKAAMQEPARTQGVTFTDEAAERLLAELRTVKTHRPSHDVEAHEAPYVDPFQLQVTCRNLWRLTKRAKGTEFSEIDADDVELRADVSQALRGYYAGIVADVAKDAEVEESSIRDWFETELINQQHLRSQTLSAPDVPEDASGKVRQALQDAYLVRGDLHANSTWYELSHDKLIEPILADNDAWRRARLDPWQLVARQWQSNRQSRLLLSGRELREATEKAERIDLSQGERDFLEESVRRDRERGVLERTRSALGLIGFLAFVELLVILVLGVIVLNR